MFVVGVTALPYNHMYARFSCIVANHSCSYNHRLQAELEEAREEARIKAQEEIVARIQEAKVTIVTVDNSKRICHFTKFKINLCGFFSNRRSPNKNYRNRNNNTRNESHIFMKLW